MYLLWGASGDTRAVFSSISLLVSYEEDQRVASDDTWNDNIHEDIAGLQATLIGEQQADEA